MRQRAGMWVLVAGVALLGAILGWWWIDRPAGKPSATDTGAAPQAAPKPPEAAMGSEGAGLAKGETSEPPPVTMESAGSLVVRVRSGEDASRALAPVAGAQVRVWVDDSGKPREAK